MWRKEMDGDVIDKKWKTTRSYETSVRSRKGASTKILYIVVSTNTPVGMLLQAI